MALDNLTHDDIPKTYGDLVGLFMPRPLHDEVDYNNVLIILDAMAGFEMNEDQEDFFEALSMFVEKYESEHHSIESRNLEPVEILRLLMDENGMDESDLGRLLGDRSLGHRILKGERKLSKAHIRTLSDKFALSPAVFYK